MYKFIPVKMQKHYYKVHITNPKDENECVTSVNSSSYPIESYAQMIKDKIKYPVRIEEIDEEAYQFGTTIGVNQLCGIQFYEKVIEHKTKMVEWDEITTKVIPFNDL
jgi:hypothetical protein